MSQVNKRILQQSYQQFQQIFWRYPDRVFALRSTFSMGVISIPFIIAGLPFYGVTLALGALAGALSETDDHPKGRVKALAITILSFFFPVLL